MSWGKVRLGEIVVFSKGKKHNAVVTGRNRYINIENLHDPNNSLFTDDTGTFVNEDDLIIAWDGANAGKVGVGFDGVIGSTLVRLRIIHDNVYPRYLFWVLESMNNVIKSQRTGATIPHVNGSALKQLQIPLPPLPIQKQIAAILDAADALRRKDQELLKKYDELAQAIFIDMFGDPVKNEKGWEERKIKDIISKDKYAIKAGPFGSSLKKEFYTNSGYKIYGQEQVIVDDLSIGNYYIDEDRYSLLKHCAVNEGDVLISLVGTYGKIAVIPKEFEKGIINPRLMKISVDKEIYNPYFLKYLLQTNQMYDKISRLSRGGTMDIVNVGLMSEVLVIVPPLTKQEKFIKVYNDLQTAKSIVKSHKSDALFNSLIQKAFKGKLVKEEALV